MLNKKFYQTRFVEFYNGYKVVDRTYCLHYGEFPEYREEHSYNTYEEFFKALKEGEIASKEFAVDYNFLGNKLNIYTYSWDEKYKLKPKQFKSYTKMVFNEVCHPTIKEITDRLPAEELSEWYKDQGIKIPSLCDIEDINVTDNDLNIIKSYKAGKTPQSVKDNIKSKDGVVKEV